MKRAILYASIAIVAMLSFALGHSAKAQSQCVPVSGSTIGLDTCPADEMCYAKGHALMGTCVKVVFIHNL